MDCDSLTFAVQPLSVRFFPKELKKETEGECIVNDQYQVYYVSDSQQLYLLHRKYEPD